MVSHKKLVDILCEQIRNDVDLSGFKALHFEKLDKEDKFRIEEDMYDMMYTFRTMPIKIYESMIRNGHIILS